MEAAVKETPSQRCYFAFQCFNLAHMRAYVYVHFCERAIYKAAGSIHIQRVHFPERFTGP